MKYFSAFSGIGGFELLMPKDWECVGYSEINKYAIQVYERRFPNHKNYGDITKIRTEDLPNFDLFLAGFPCQSFSIAGKRWGFNDTRGTLFFEIARILWDKRPRYFLLENVKGLLSHEGGKTFQTILGVLSNLGYGLEWQVLNSKNHGVPQNRERVFFVGYFGEGSKPKVFPFGDGNGVAEKNGMNGMGLVQVAQVGKKDNMGQRVYDTQGIATSQRAEGGGQGAKTGLYLQNAKIRRLTPKECERVMGFPDNWTEGLSDTQRYKCLGNAVVPQICEAIYEKIEKYEKIYV